MNFLKMSSTDLADINAKEVSCEFRKVFKIDVAVRSRSA